MDTEKLCPFKKTVDRECISPKKVTLHERFEVCAGERRMAYVRGKCLRLEIGGGPMVSRVR